ncbi:MAG: O-linked N-acetylglucosamine transferase, SPINDLY family protein [Rhodospirillales bacterium]|jgi:predicted O-linked N-acetylglucosamine transferase (SPINDLY family)|nr:O-linked N-acetylglucosamine transferase, SPINDLY family protein [Rhodospirillales bacterium]
MVTTAAGWEKMKAGDVAGAQAAFAAALDRDPKEVPALHGMGRLALMAKQFEYAASLLKQAYALAPEDEALAIDFAQALAGEAVGRPQDAKAQFNLALVFLGLGDIEAARDTFLNAYLADPQHAPSRWMVNRLLPRVYMNPGEIAVWRRRLLSGIAALEASILPKTPAEAEAHVPGLMTRTNFELAYQGQDDKPIQELYGRLVSRVMAAWLPDLAKPIAAMPFAARSDRRIRVGFASSYFTSHTIALLFGGWVRHLDRKRFIVHGYLTGGTPDASTRSLAGMCDQFRDLRGKLDDTARRIRDDDLDVLIYPDIGMDGRGQALAALRLAPTQAVAMGHPVTTGLPSIDYFLTSGLMEPEGGEAHYSEKLVRLPNLSFAYRPPAYPQTKTRQDFGLPGEGPVYLCCQALQKYLPQFDRVFPAIAARIEKARFVFIQHKTRHLDNRRFQARLEGVFRSQGLDPSRHLVFLPWQEWTDYLQLNGACDVFLDSIGWSGGNTALEALSRALPIVTLPSNLMRGRHAFAMLKLLGLDDCIASDLENYAAIAVRLGTDAGFNAEVRERIRAGQGRLYDDTAPVRALEDFLEKTARG